MDTPSQQDCDCQTEHDSRPQSEFIPESFEHLPSPGALLGSVDQRRARRRTIVKAPPKTMVNARTRVCELESKVCELTLEKDTLKSGGVLRAGAVVKYAFIRGELVGTCTTRLACRLLEVSPSGYYQFSHALPAPRKERMLAIASAVVRIHAESRRIYGLPKITR